MSSSFASAKPNPFCWECGISSETMQQCNGCSNAIYCSEKCQHIHWEIKHKFMCQPFVGKSVNLSEVKTVDIKQFFAKDQFEAINGRPYAVLYYNNVLNKIVKKSKHPSKLDNDSLANEYVMIKMIDAIFESLGDVNLHLNDSIPVEVVAFYNQAVDEDGCVYMEGLPLSNIKHREQYTWAAKNAKFEPLLLNLTDERDHRFTMENGEYIGMAEFHEIVENTYPVTKAEIAKKSAYYNLGRFMARLHLLAMIDGSGLDFALKTYRYNLVDNLAITAFNFENCTTFDDWEPSKDLISQTNTTNVDKCVEALMFANALPQFNAKNPTKNTYYNEFKRGYLDVAKDHKRTVLAGSIFAKLEYKEDVEPPMSQDESQDDFDVDGDLDEDKMKV